MGKSERRKGINAERELVNLLKKFGIISHRVPLSGSMENYKNDIILENGSTIEVKRRNRIPKIFRELLKDSNYGAIREDRGDWLVVMRLKEFVNFYRR